MAFLYHLRPPQLAGSVLLPLNRLRDAHSAVYESERRKYEGREVLHELVIPQLDVRWGDVLHFSPFHPTRLARAWSEAGLSSSFWAGEFLEVPAGLLRGRPCVVLASGEVRGGVDGRPTLAVADVTPFDPDAFREPTEVPARYVEHLRERRRESRPSRPFAYLPHVLLAGELDVSGLRLVRAAAPSR